MASPPAPATRLERRQAREARILDAARDLFDERGVAGARVDAIARAAGIDKALIYRHFSSKEELHLLTLRRYLDELAELLAEVDATAPPAERLRACADRFATYCLEHPAFVDVSLAVMRRPPGELRRVVPEAVWLRLGRGMARCLGPLAAILAAGHEQAAFVAQDPDFTANHLYAQVLGTVHLARTGVGVREEGPGVPATFPIDADRVREACVAAALATVGSDLAARGS
jgi:AcrR family transcriptional regulator